MQQNERRGALCYIADFTCRHLRKKIEKENGELKEEMILCLMSLVKDKEDSTCGIDKGWTNSLDPGWFMACEGEHISALLWHRILHKTIPRNSN